MRPSDDEIEVSILGGGNGYGECVLVHAGFGFWIVADSAQDPVSGQPLALSYFNQLDLNPSNSVKLIVASHWHDDHIRGLSRVVDLCPNARFVCSQGLEQSQFTTLLGVSSKIPSRSSGLQEFVAIFSPGRRIVRAIQDRILLDQELDGGIQLRITSLSPSDGTIRLFEEQLKKIILDSGPSKVISTISPNHHSVVTLIKIGNDEICLGGDLENTKRPDLGWQAVLDAEAMPRQTVGLFKVPHHGSMNAYHPDFWNKALSQEPIAGLTPFVRGKTKLPSKEGIQTILGHTQQAFITALPDRGREKKRDPRTQRILRDLGYRPQEIPFSFGHIRMRKKFADSIWKVDLFGKAQRLTPLS